MSQPIPYQLDTLGWMQFEYLIQVLLKSELGIGVESWGGSADHGKDAYCTTELNFPSRHTTNPGPFVFQAKFVSSANAAGADFEHELTSAISKEVALIARRLETGRWKSAPQQYALFTNAPVSANQRQKLAELLKQTLPTTSVSIQGATDICVLLDLNISVSRAFPQILSLRNFTELLANVVRNDSIQRSDGAIREAEALAAVFVPTKAYDRAWTVLTKHDFVVLEGPPEMGKTAIAWMIAAVQLAHKWEAIDCDTPNEFFKNFTEGRDQVFIADDAFGSTEYEATRGTEWSRNLHKILPKLDSHHWLVWTTRMHILQKALHEMTLQGKAAKFPKPAEVLVNASKLEREERALMLYRHSRAAFLESTGKEIIRSYAATVVDNDHFTPERIKRFVSERLPGLAEKRKLGTLSDELLAEAVKDAIENPTDRMRKAFAKLEDSQKWLLIALLDTDRMATLNELEASFRRFTEMRRPISEEVLLLREGFLEEYVDRRGARALRWIHPSYRDLVIEELEKDENRAIKFLECCSLEGIKLAVSVAGGAKGQRQFPLMSAPRSWDILEDRLIEIIRDAHNERRVSDTLSIMRTATMTASPSGDVQSRLAKILTSCCDAARLRWDEADAVLDSSVVEEFFDATMCLVPPPTMPALLRTLNRAEQEYEKAMDDLSKRAIQLDAGRILRWASVVKVVSKSDPRLLIQSGFPESYREKVEKICEEVRGDADSSWSREDPDVLSSEQERFTVLSTALNDLVGLIPQIDDLVNETASLAESHANHLEQKYRESVEQPEESPDVPDEYRPPGTYFDLERLFSDL